LPPLKFDRSNWYPSGLLPLVNVSTGTFAAGLNGPAPIFVITVSFRPPAGIVPLKSTWPLPLQFAEMLVTENPPLVVVVVIAGCDADWATTAAPTARRMATRSAPGRAVRGVRGSNRPPKSALSRSRSDSSPVIDETKSM